MSAGRGHRGAPVVPDDEAGRAAAVEVLRAGGIVALPTDTVYGLAMRLGAPADLERLFELKGRPPDRALPVLLSGAGQAADLGRMGPAAGALAAAFWPGALTLVIPVRDDVALPTALTRGAATVGIRVPDHAAPRALAAAVGPLASTSANVSGHPELTDAAAIADMLGSGVGLILDGGPAHGGPASTVVAADGTATRVLRRGAISVERLAAVLRVAGLPAPVA